MLDRVSTENAFADKLKRSAEAMVAELKAISGCTKDLPVQVDTADFSVSASPELKMKLTSERALVPVSGQSREVADTVVRQKCSELGNGDWLARHVRAPGASKLPGSFEADFDATCATCAGQKKVGCETCSSSGKVTCGGCTNGKVSCSCGDGKEKCGTCNGSGRVVNRPEPTGFFAEEPKQTMSYQYHCTSCGGSGKSGWCRSCGGTARRTCSYCGGSSKVTCSTCHGATKVDCSDCGAHGIRAYTLRAHIQVVENLKFTREDAKTLRHAVLNEEAARRQYDELQRHDLSFDANGKDGQYSFSGRFHRASVVKDDKLLMYFDHPDESAALTNELYELLTKRVRSQLASNNYGALAKSPLGKSVLGLISNPGADAPSMLRTFDPSGSLIKAARDVGSNLSDEITKGRFFRKAVPAVIPAILIGLITTNGVPPFLSSSEFALRFEEQTRFELMDFVAAMILFVLPSLLCSYYYLRERAIIRTRTPRGVTISGDARDTGFKKLFLISAVALPATPFILAQIAYRFL